MTKIKICDAIMGSGKTTAAINYMNGSDGKFVFITPYLAECDRIIEGCPDKDFKSPRGEHRSKLMSLHYLLGQGCSVSSTHALFSSYTDETVQLIKDGHYTLIMDEVFDVVQEMHVTKEDLNDLKASGYIKVDEATCKVTWLNDNYIGSHFQDLMTRAKSGTVYYFNDTFLFWMFPPEVFRAFDEVIVLTYMFDAQLQRYYFDSNGFYYQYISVGLDERGDYSFVDKGEGERKIPGLKDKISILDEQKFNYIGDNRYALSAHWSEKAFKNKDKAKRMTNDIYNVLHNKFKGKAGNSMWTAYKGCQACLTKKGYKSSFVPFNARATNAYRECTNLAYCVNVFLNPFMRAYFNSCGCEIDEDRYALSEMVQWVWRSAIREGQNINLYVPSRRMRNLFTRWLDEVGGE